MRSSCSLKELKFAGVVWSMDSWLCSLKDNVTVYEFVLGIVWTKFVRVLSSKNIFYNYLNISMINGS